MPISVICTISGTFQVPYKFLSTYRMDFKLQEAGFEPSMSSVESITAIHNTSNLDFDSNLYPQWLVWVQGHKITKSWSEFWTLLFLLEEVNIGVNQKGRIRMRNKRCAVHLSLIKIQVSTVWCGIRLWFAVVLQVLIVKHDMQEFMGNSRARSCSRHVDIFISNLREGPFANVVNYTS